MDATQMISDSILESDEEENEENENKRGRPLAKLHILKNEHIPETELPLFLGDNVLGRDPNTCTLPLPAPSVSKQHATICISVYRRRGCPGEVDTEALVWDLGSMNGTRKGHLKLTPNVRYALSERDSLVVADIPCQYVSCAIDTVSSQGNMRTSVSRLPDASGEKGGDTSTGSKKCVNGGTKARVSLPNQDKRETPVRISCLSFEQTPTQPQGSLVPESDSDSDGERGDRRRKALASDSSSHKSSPSCSTFLSPANKIVPESEDESSITPSSSSTKNRPYRCATFSKEETEVDAGRQQLKEKKALVFVDDSDKEEERAALGGRKSEGSGQHVPVKQESNVSLTGEDELPVSTPAVFTGAIPAFDMDSDTDVEGEEEGVASAGHVTLSTNRQADQPPNTAQIHMDSDTDVDEDEDALDKVVKSVPSSVDHTKPHAIQPEGITMDSDTDVDDDDDAAVSDAAAKAKPTSQQSTQAADSAPSTQPKDFHLDSDTDADEEEEKDCGTNNAQSKIDETPTRSDVKPVGNESAAATPQSLNLDSDTDDEAIPAPAISEPLVAVLSDSDTDVEDEAALVIPVTISTLSGGPSVISGALQSGSDADKDVDESSAPPAGDGVVPADPRVDSDTDVEDNEVDFGEAGEGQIPILQRENTPGLLVPLQQNCSTPVQVSEGGLENMDTQAFLTPSSGPFRGVVAPAARPLALSSCSDSQEDDFVVEETQSFILQTGGCNPPEDHTMDPTQSFSHEFTGDERGEQSSREGSFQLGLSDSSHLQGQAHALAMENTQSFVSVMAGVNMQNTQAYADISNADGISIQNDSNLEEHGRCSVVSAKEGQVDLALEATQAYISEPYADSEDETDEDERKHAATAETQPFHFATSSTLAMAETQPMPAFEEENLDEENPVSSVLQHGEAAQSAAQSVAETQPMATSGNEESDEEDLIPGPRKRKAKQLQLEDEQTQTLKNSEPMHSDIGETQPMDAGDDGESDEEDSIPDSRKRRAKPLQLEEETQPFMSSEVSVAETQPMARSGNEESDEEDLIPGPRKRKVKQLQHEDEQTQTLTNSDLTLVETQPMNSDVSDTQPVDADDDGESDEEDSMPGPRKRRAKPLPLEEESQTLTNSEVSAVETQPMGACEGEQSDEEDSTPGPRKRKRKVKALQLEEEETQPLTSSEVPAVEIQPFVAGEDKKSDEDSTPGPRKRRGKPQQIQEEETQPPTHSEASTVETTGKGKRSEAGTSGTTTRGRRGTRASLREVEEQAECPEPPKRQTRGKSKALPPTRGRRGKSRPDEEESEEEEEVEQTKRARGKKSMRQQKDNEKEEKRPGTERNKHAENNNLIKEQEDKLERERKEKEEQERVQAENAERSRLEQERAEKERKEQEDKERADRAQKEKEELERERKKEEKERLEREKAEREEKERIEKERKKEEKERLEREKAERKEKERIEKERKKEEKERLEREKAEREEKERIEKEKKKEEKERLEREKAEREEKERKEKEEKERLETAKRELEERLERERKEQEHQVRLEKEAKEREEKERLEKDKQEKEATEKQIKEQQENKDEENKKTPARSRQAARRTIAAPCATEEDDVPARRTRSRSSSSNSVSSERSASSVSTQGSRGRGRGRGAKRTSGPPPAAVNRNSNRRRTVAAEPTQQDGNNGPPQGVLSMSNSTNSEIYISSVSSQSRGRGGRQRGRGRKTDSIPPISSDQSLTPKPTARGRKTNKTEESSNEDPHEDDDKEKADSQQASTTRGRRGASGNDSDPAGDKEDPSNQECATEESPRLKRNVRGRGQRTVKIETVEAPVAPATSDGDEPEEKRKGRKRELETNREEDASSSSKISKGKEKAQMTEAAGEEEAKGETRDEPQVQVKRRGRVSSAQAKKNIKELAEVEVKEESEKMEEVAERRGKGRPSVVQRKKKEEQEGCGTSVDQGPHVEASEPQTPTSSVSRKRRAPVDSSPMTKTPRSSSASPAAGGRLRAASQTYKVLFTGVVDEDGERVLARLGGSMANGVADMNCLVTDKVRRTVKFLCAVAKGVPIVTTHWLEKSGKCGSFLSPNAFLVKDPEQEKKFSFCLQESLRIAGSQPLLQGYEIHVTKSVKPEPVHMKDIISCSGATFLPKMPSSFKPQTVVISCEEDWPLCGPALSASLPVVTAEFILTGILQQKRDLQTHALSAPVNTPQPAGGRGRGRKKT